MSNIKANSKELAYKLHPKREKFKWIIFYGVLGLGILIGFLAFANRLHTYTIPSGSVSLVVPYKTYLLGETVTFTVNNSYNSTIYIKNECPDEPLNVYRLEGSKWERLHDKTSEVSCTAKERQVAIEPFTSQSGNYKNWPKLFSEPGKYRIVAYVEYFNTVAYQDFEVIQPPSTSSPTSDASDSSSRTSSSAQSSIQSNQSNTSQSSAGSGSTNSGSGTYLKTFNFAQGDINIQYDNNLIYIKSISTVPGCGYEKNGTVGKSIEVTFKCGGSETQIGLFNSNGNVSYSVQH